MPCTGCHTLFYARYIHVQQVCAAMGRGRCYASCVLLRLTMVLFPPPRFIDEPNPFGSRTSLNVADPQLEGRAVAAPRPTPKKNAKNGTMHKQFTAPPPTRPSHDERDASPCSPPSDENVKLVTTSKWAPSVPPPLPSSVPGAPAWFSTWLQRQQPSHAPPPMQDEAPTQQDEAPGQQGELPIPPPPPLPIPPPPPKPPRKPRQRGGSTRELFGVKFHRDHPPWKHETLAAREDLRQSREDRDDSEAKAQADSSQSMWSVNNDRASSSNE